MHHVLSSEQFDPESLGVIFAQADEFREILDEVAVERYRDLAARHVGARMLNLFYEPSTRTRLSFGSAADALGVRVQTTENAKEFSSAAKGETLEDTIRVLNEYLPDIIVLRHDETGAAGRAAAVSHAAIINAGDGKGEHPTQSLLDAYTIHRNHGRLDNLNIVMGGDLKQGRTARSLAKLLAKYPGNQMTFVSVPELQMGEDIQARLQETNTPFEQTTDMYDALRTADVVYWTRIQKERLEKPEPLNGDAYVIDTAALEVMKPTATIMHPLPRVGEITNAVDSDPRAKYFEQAGNGLYIRMALIDQILTT